MSRVSPQRTALVCLCLIFLTPFLLRAAPQTRVIFGPERSARATGGPADESREFTVPTNGAAPFVLEVVNGDPASGRDRVTSAWITIDGHEIVGPSGSPRRSVRFTRRSTFAQDRTVCPCVWLESRARR